MLLESLRVWFHTFWNRPAIGSDRDWIGYGYGEQFQGNRRRGGDNSENERSHERQTDRQNFLLTMRKWLRKSSDDDDNEIYTITAGAVYVTLFPPREVDLGTNACLLCLLSRVSLPPSAKHKHTRNFKPSRAENNTWDVPTRERVVAVKKWARLSVSSPPSCVLPCVSYAGILESDEQRGQKLRDDTLHSESM